MEKLINSLKILSSRKNRQLLTKIRLRNELISKKTFDMIRKFQLTNSKNVEKSNKIVPSVRTENLLCNCDKMTFVFKEFFSGKYLYRFLNLEDYTNSFIYRLKVSVLVENPMKSKMLIRLVLSENPTESIGTFNNVNIGSHLSGNSMKIEGIKTRNRFFVDEIKRYKVKQSMSRLVFNHLNLNENNTNKKFVHLLVTPKDLKDDYIQVEFGLKINMYVSTYLHPDNSKDNNEKFVDSSGDIVKIKNIFLL
jgi:hypothetical protein